MRVQKIVYFTEPFSISLAFIIKKVLKNDMIYDFIDKFFVEVTIMNDTFEFFELLPNIFNNFLLI